ncbi:MAG: CoA pyrophosphatase [Phascolarctobacterium sp.]|nr:CoA pyrophosphatase [Phascolarctobacterium sp.]
MKSLEKILREEFNKRPAGIDMFDSLWTAAVLLPLVMKEDGPHILFEVRAKNLRRQPGEICFPGGKHECKDESYEITCVRETCEELGIEPEDIEVLGEQDSLVTYRGPVIHVFVGVIKHPEKINASPSEVDEIFTVPLKFFLETEPRVGLVDLLDEPQVGYPYELVPARYVGQRKLGTYKVYFYEYAGRVIWGLTARFIYGFLRRHKDNLFAVK